KKILLILTATALFFTACTKKGGHDVSLTDSFISGELAQVAKERQLEPKHLIAAAKTYSPSGAKNEYLALMGTGVSGRLVVMSMPAMKILKYVAVFSAEPWQGFAFDDQSKAITKASARDEIEYAYGDSEKPATSLTNGKHDARAV